MWIYAQKSGKLQYDSGKVGNETVGWGYSGHGIGLNQPSQEGVHGVGPCPAGLYTMGPWHDHPHLGPCVSELTPVPPFNALGRTELFIHGDNQELNHSASDGCIILNKLIRHYMRSTGDTSLTVTP